MQGYLVIANAQPGSVEREALDAAVGVLSAASPEVQAVSRLAQAGAARPRVQAAAHDLLSGDGGRTCPLRRRRP